MGLEKILGQCSQLFENTVYFGHLLKKRFFPSKEEVELKIIRYLALGDEMHRQGWDYVKYFHSKTPHDYSKIPRNSDDSLIAIKDLNGQEWCVGLSLENSSGFVDAPSSLRGHYVENLLKDKIKEKKWDLWWEPYVPNHLMGLEFNAGDEFDFLEEIEKAVGKAARINNSLEESLYETGISQEFWPLIQRAYEDLSSKEVDKLTSLTGSKVIIKARGFDKENIERQLVGKVAASDSLAREHHYLTEAWKRPILQPITAKPFGLIIPHSPIGIMFTYHTEDTPISRESVQKYLQKRLQAINKLSDMHQYGIDDPALVDAFNLALHHTYMRDEINNQLLHEPVSPTIYPFTFLLERSGLNRNNHYFAQFKSLESRYNEAASRYKNTPSVSWDKVIVHGDLRAENTFPGVFRSLGDFATAHIYTPEQDLSRFDFINGNIIDQPAKYQTAYLFFRELLERERGNDFAYTPEERQNILGRAKALNYLKPIRDLSFRIGKERYCEADKLLRLIHYRAENK